MFICCIIINGVYSNLNIEVLDTIAMMVINSNRTHLLQILTKSSNHCNDDEEVGYLCDKCRCDAQKSISSELRSAGAGDVDN